VKHHASLPGLAEVQVGTGHDVEDVIRATMEIV
jgi:hypothetical protein